MEDLVEQGKEEMDGYIAEYEKGLTAGQGNAGDAGKQVGDGKPSSRNQTFTGTAGGVKVTVLFDKSVNAEKVTIKEVTQPDLVEILA